MKYSILSGVLSIFLSVGCGGYRPDLARGPHIHPAVWLTGHLEGRILVFDRNGNIRETGLVERQCTLTDSTEGRCSDTETLYTPSARTTKRNLLWTIRYLDGNTMVLKMKNEDGLLVGHSLGALLLLDGRRRIPGSTTDANVDLRIERLHGPNDPVLSTEEFSRWGLRLGMIQTFWVRK